MGTLTVFHGTLDEAIRLAEAVRSNCECQALHRQCAAHAAMLDQRFIDNLLFERWLKARLEAQEFDPQARGGVPTILSEG